MSLIEDLFTSPQERGSPVRLGRIIARLVESNFYQMREVAIDPAEEAIVETDGPDVDFEALNMIPGDARVWDVVICYRVKGGWCFHVR